MYIYIYISQDIPVIIYRLEINEKYQTASYIQWLVVKIGPPAIYQWYFAHFAFEPKNSSGVKLRCMAAVSVMSTVEDCSITRD